MHDSLPFPSLVVRSGWWRSAPYAAAGAIVASDHAVVSGTQCRLDGNSARSQLAAGAVYADGAAAVTLTNATPSDNSADGHPTAGSIFGRGAGYRPLIHIPAPMRPP